MNYIEWANEYQTEADKLKLKLNGLKKELREKQSEHSDGIRALTHRIAVLYSMYLDCKHIAAILRQRGEGENGKEIVA